MGTVDTRAAKLGLVQKWTSVEDLILIKRISVDDYSVQQYLPRHMLFEIRDRIKILGL